MPKGRSDYDFMRVQKALGRDVSKKEPFLAETACMGFEERRKIAMLEIYRLMYKDDPEFDEFLKNIAIRSMQLLGYSSFIRDVFTDLAFMLPAEKSRISFSDILARATNTTPETE